MDKTQAQQFRDRWQAVEQIQQQETLSATLENRWRQLNAAYGMAQSLHLPVQPSDEMRVYQRWLKLKENPRQPLKA